MKNDWGGNRKRGWRNAVGGRLVKILWSSSCVTVLCKLSFSKGGPPLRGKVVWDSIVYWS